MMLAMWKTLSIAVVAFALGFMARTWTGPTVPVQAQGFVYVQEASMSLGALAARGSQVVGLSCVSESGQTKCFVASR